LLQHFERVSLLSALEVRGWLEQQSDWSSTTVAKKGAARNAASKTKAPNDSREALLIAAFEHRNDPRLNVWHSAFAEFPTSSSRIATVLGSDWQGHRRTLPRPDATESFYWFQLFDRMIPWVLRTSQIEQPPSSLRKSKLAIGSGGTGTGGTGSGGTGSGGTNPRVVRLLEHYGWYEKTLEPLATQNQLAWIVSDHREHRMAWQETLVSYGVRTVSSRPGDGKFWATPDLMVIDCSARDDHPSEQISPSMREVVIHARGMYPEAFLVLADPFPAWERWGAWLELGVDALVPRPADFAGTLVSWQLWARGNAGIDNHAISR
jgi:hypothetical protein